MFILKALRKKAGLKQEEVAELMGVTPNTVSNWEVSGKFRSSADMHKLLDIYHASQRERAIILQLCYGDERSEEYVAVASILETVRAINQAKAALRAAYNTLSKECEANPILQELTCGDGITTEDVNR